MKDTVYMSDLHFDHKMWENQLKFQKEELNFFRDRLEEVAGRWTDEKVLQQVEHFQNAFLVHSNKIDELQHNINVHEDELVDRVKDNPVAIDRVHFEDHKEQREDIETQWKLYNELKADYLDFLRMAM
jgi:hypothetical protein